MKHLIRRVTTEVKEQSYTAFMLLDRFGIHLLPKHYYTPIPDYRWLRNNKKAWVGRAPLTGVEWNVDQQLAWLTETCAPSYAEVAGLGFYDSLSDFPRRGFGPIESQVLHCFVRATAPPRIVEIGSGMSTACLRHAIRLNREQGRPASELTCIEPFPLKVLQEMKDIHLIRQLCQEVPWSVFAQLQAGDFLFVDSSHTVKVGSDLIRIYLDIIPKLPPGVFVHIHDVHLPYLYAPDVLMNYFGWQENALLLALLTNNPHLSVLASLSALHYDRPDALGTLLTDYRPQPSIDGLRPTKSAPGHSPSSLWLQTV